MRVVRKLWRGEYTLPVAFWGFYCGGLLTGVLVSLLMFIADRLVFYADLVVDPIPIASIVWDVLFWAYLVVASVAVWRSADPYWVSPIGMRRFWAGAARVFVVVWIANVARVLMNG
jgi:hypothetical protein